MRLCSRLIVIWGSSCASFTCPWLLAYESARLFVCVFQIRISFVTNLRFQCPRHVVKYKPPDQRERREWDFMTYPQITIWMKSSALPSDRDGSWTVKILRRNDFFVFNFTWSTFNFVVRNGYHFGNNLIFSNTTFYWLSKLPYLLALGLHGSQWLLFLQ